MFSSRTYPSTFRSLLPTDVKPELLKPDNDLRVKCQCGAFSFAVKTAASTPPLRCHCVRCRKFHASAFATLLSLPRAPDGLLDDSRLRKYESPCDGLGKPLSRLFCGNCRSVLGATSGDDFYLALGCVEDESIPPPLALSYQTRYESLSADQSAVWWTAKPSNQGRPTAPPRVLRGSCACGKCAFEAPSGSEFQTQHCYCNLCRRLSGTVGQTWVPVRPTGWRWTRDETLKLIRTTGHGSRHMCEECGTTLTIVYDSQPDCLWPVAGVIDDDSLPKDMESALCRSIHICCSMMQPWFKIPDDDLPRLKYAG